MHLKSGGEPQRSYPSHTANRPRVLSKDFLRPNPPAASAGAAEGKGAASAGAAEGKGAPHPGRGRASLWLPEPLRPGKTQNAGATESTLLWRTRKLEPHSTQGPLHIEQPGA